MMINVVLAVGLQFIRTVLLIGLSHMYQMRAGRRSVDGREGHN